MGALREANSKHTSGVKTIVFSQKVILVQDFLEKKGEWGLRRCKNERRSYFSQRE